MEESKKRKLKYTRKWKHVKKSLNKATNEDEVSDSETDEIEIIQRNTNSIIQNSTLVNPRFITEDDSSDHDYDVNENDDSVWDVIDRLNETHNICHSSENESEDDTTEELKHDLASWVNEFQTKHNAVDSLLKMLQRHGHPDLPMTARTLLGTTKTVETETKSGMQYYYFGLQAELRKHLDKYPADVLEQSRNVQISLNIDGLPLFKSTNESLWPVLCEIHLHPAIVFPVALTCGKSKPTDLTFLDDLIRDLNDVSQTGLNINETILNIQIRCIVCDAPARAMVLKCKQYSGYYGCERCTQKGSWFQKVTYPEVDNLILRTDESFRAQNQPGHHTGTSPFCRLQINMVQAFPLDYMHLACLGVMKRLLILWTRGIRETRMSAGQINEVNIKLQNLRTSIPSLFARKPRPLTDVDRWKATEFRQFLLYTGKFVLKDILKPELFDNFMTLSVAMCILICPSLVKTHIAYARQLLQYFVSDALYLYGQGMMVYNIHGLLHLADDAETFGALDNCSAFPFENYLQQLKKFVRSGKNPLAQIVKRLHERDNVTVTYAQPKNAAVASSPNNAFILNKTSCCEVVAVSKEDDENRMLLCRLYEKTEDYFKHPCESHIIGVQVGSLRNSRMKIMPDKCLQKQAILTFEDSKAIFTAVLHKY